MDTRIYRLRDFGLFSDAEAAKNAVEDVVGNDFSDYAAEAVERLAKIDRH